MLVCVGCGRSARGDAKLGEDVAHVTINGPLAEDEFGGDGLVGLACGYQAKHLQLTRRQPMINMSTFQIVHQITLPERMNPSTIDVLEEFMRQEYFPAVFKGPTRVGQVTSLALLRGVAETHERINTFLMQVGFDGLASGGARVDEEMESKLEAFGARIERLGVYANVAVWPKEAEV